jgi:hypothetical protein
MHVQIPFRLVFESTALFNGEHFVFFLWTCFYKDIMYINNVWNNLEISLNLEEISGY